MRLGRVEREIGELCRNFAGQGQLNWRCSVAGIGIRREKGRNVLPYLVERWRKEHRYVRWDSELTLKRRK